MNLRKRYGQASFAAALSAVSLLIIFAGPPPVRAADTDVSKEVREAAAAIADYSVEQKDAAMERAREMMDDMDARIDELEFEIETNWADLKAASREKYRTGLRVLREKRNDLSEWYGSMKYSSGEAWQEVKSGFSDAYASLVDSIEEARQEMD